MNWNQITDPDYCQQLTDWPDYYVTSEGEVWSFKLCKWRKLKSLPNRQGYRQVALHLNGRSSRQQVSRLVAMHFVEGYQPGLEVDHINHDVSDNRASNLQWLTKAENLAKRHAHQQEIRGELNEQHDRITIPATEECSQILPQSLWRGCVR